MEKREFVRSEEEGEFWLRIFSDWVQITISFFFLSPRKKIPSNIFQKLSREFSRLVVVLHIII